MSKTFLEKLFNSKQELQDLEYMSPVEAARMYRGSPMAYYLSFAMLFLFLLFMLWICTAERNEVTQASGQIIPSQGIQPVQSKDNGIIKEILVSENELVEQGALLGYVSNIQAIGEYEELNHKRIECEVTLQRLIAEQNNTPLEFSAEQRQKYTDAVTDQERLFRTRHDRFEGEHRQLQATLKQRELELLQTRQRREQFEQQLVLLHRQEKQVQPLFKAGTYAAIDYLNLKQRIVAMESDLKSLFVTIDRTESAVQEASDALQNSEPVRLSAIAKEISAYRQELDSVNERLKAGSQLVDDSDLRAVVRGTVKRVLLREGAVVRAAELIMEIIPSDDALEIDAKFSPPPTRFFRGGAKGDHQNFCL